MATAVRARTASVEQFFADAFLHWQDERTASRGEFSRRVLEEIRFEAVRGMHSFAHGGVEVGGILLGENIAGVLRVLDWRPIRCGHAQGPVFSLSAADRGRLASQLDLLALDEETSPMEVLGLFVSHARGADELRADEADLAARYFPGAHQILLVVKPDRFGPANVQVFRRAAAGGVLEPAGAAFTVEVRPLPAYARASRPKVFLAATAASARPSRSGWALPLFLWVCAAALLGLTVAGPLWPVAQQLWQRTGLHRPEPIAMLSLVARQEASGIELRWRPSGDALHASGTLEWQQGAADQTRFLTPGELRAGRAVLPADTAAQRVRLTVSNAAGETLREEAAIVRLPPPPEPPEVAAKPKPKAKAKTAKIRRARRRAG